MTAAILWQALHVALMLAIAPLLAGVARTVRARLLGRRGPPLLQPYRDLRRLLQKEAIVADTASPLLRAAPTVVLAAIAAAAALVPSFTTEMALRPTADIIAVIGLLGVGRFALALAGLDAGTSFGGIGTSREIMIAVVAEPAMLLVVFTWALLVGTTSLPAISEFGLSGAAGVRVSLALALVALVIVALAENARIPVDNPATHLELTMVHEAMVLEYAGRHLALIEAAAMLKLTVYLALIAALFAPWGMAPPSGAAGGGSAGSIGIGIAAFAGKMVVGAALLSLFETSIAKMRVFRVPEFLGVALLLGLLAMILLYMTKGF